MNGLTDKQQAFCQEYVFDMNAKEAAVRAGYSAHTAKQQGHRLLNTPVCRAEIERLWLRGNRKQTPRSLSVEYVLELIPLPFFLARAKQQGPY